MWRGVVFALRILYWRPVVCALNRKAQNSLSIALTFKLVQSQSKRHDVDNADSTARDSGTAQDRGGKYAVDTG